MENFVNWFERQYDYLNEEVPFMELETPRNEKEMELLRLRVRHELGPALLRMAYLDNEEVNITEDTHKIEKFSIVRVVFPYMHNTEMEEKARPSLIIVVDVIDNTPICMEITSVKKKRKINRYDVILHEWKELGLDNKSVVKTDCVRHIDQVQIVGKPVGYITYKIYLKVMKKFYLFLDEALDTPYNFVNLLNMYKIEDTKGKNRLLNNNYNGIQLAEDIAKSRYANCVDIAVATHYICKDANMESKLALVACRFIGGHKIKTNGHVVTIFKNKDVFNILNYDQVENHIGEIINYKNRLTYEEVASEFLDTIEKRLKGTLVDYEKVIYVFDNDDMKLVDNKVWIKSHTQIELLQNTVYKKGVK